MALLVQALSERVYELLRERIVTLAIAPGQIIRQDALAAELGISKIPVREALSRLQVAGLVEHAPNRGFSAPPLSGDELDDIFHLRLMVEPATAAIGAERADADAKGEVRRALQALTESAELSSTAPQRKALLLALMAPARRPATELLARRMFYLAERYLPDTRPSRDLNIRGLHALTDSWIAQDSAAVEAGCRARLEHRWTQARRLLGSAPPDA